VRLARNIDLATAAKAEQPATPSARDGPYLDHGVFEEAIREICQIVHDHGGRCTWTART